MSAELRCPSCSAALAAYTEEIKRCPEGHDYTATALALATNRGSVKALWLAIRALKDDALGLDFLAQRDGSPHAESRRQEAHEAREAAEQLRVCGLAAQRRLDALEAQPGPST